LARATGAAKPQHPLRTVATVVVQVLCGRRQQGVSTARRPDFNYQGCVLVKNVAHLGFWPGIGRVAAAAGLLRVGYGIYGLNCGSACIPSAGMPGAFVRSDECICTGTEYRVDRSDEYIDADANDTREVTKNRPGGERMKPCLCVVPKLHRASLLSAWKSPPVRFKTRQNRIGGRTYLMAERNRG